MMAVLTTDDVFAKVQKVVPAQGISLGDWNDKTTWVVDYLPSATEAQREEAQSVLNAIDLSITPIVMRHRVCSPKEFYNRFLTTELQALKASSDTAITEWREGMQLYQECVLDGEEMEDAMAYLVAIGILSETRIKEILA